MHLPVMVDEVVRLLQPERGGLFVDCTVGLGGHASALLEAGAMRVVGLDRDPAALLRSRARLERWADRVELVHADYRTLDDILDARGIGRIDGALADLGVSSMQLDEEGRGFSFRRDEPLDMRMDTTQGETAADLLARAEEEEIADAIYQFGEERHSRRIARAIVAARRTDSIRTTGQLATLVRRAVPTRGWQRIDPATRTFQGLRIWVNRELEGLDRFVTAVAKRLSAGARVALIAFHSLEDRIVKHTLRALEKTGDSVGLTRSARQGPPDGGPIVKVITRHPVIAGDEEIARNPRARSAKLRVAERLA